MIIYYNIRGTSNVSGSSSELRNFLNTSSYANAVDITNGYDVNNAGWPFTPTYNAMLSCKLTDNIIGTGVISTYAEHGSSYKIYCFDTSDESFFILDMPTTIDATKYFIAIPTYHDGVIYTYQLPGNFGMPNRPMYVYQNDITDFPNTTTATDSPPHTADLRGSFFAHSFEGDLFIPDYTVNLYTFNKNTASETLHLSATTNPQPPLAGMYFDETNELFWGVSYKSDYNHTLSSLGKDGSGNYSVITEHNVLPDISNAFCRGSIAGIGTDLYFFNGYNSTVRVYDASTPSSPTLKAEEYTTDIIMGTGFFSGYYGQNVYVYEANGGKKAYMPAITGGAAIANLTLV